MSWVIPDSETAFPAVFSLLVSKTPKDVHPLRQVKGRRQQHVGVVLEIPQAPVTFVAEESTPLPRDVVVVPVDISACHLFHADGAFAVLGT